MLKSTATAILLLAFSGSAFANCYGTAAMKTCTDTSGNSYTVQKFGGSTYVQGNNPNTGNSWNQNTQRHGNNSYTTGQDARGNTWTQNSQRVDNTVYQSGYDSNGNSYNGTIQRNRNSTTYSGTDSSGRSYYRTCTNLGCY